MGKKIAIFLLISILSITLLIGCQQEDTDTDETTTTAKKSEAPEVGDEAPDFTLKNQDQLNISLSDFKGEKNVILVFYPADFTPV